jgi:hypothetical protein
LFCNIFNLRSPLCMRDQISPPQRQQQTNYRPDDGGSKHL